MPRRILIPLLLAALIVPLAVAQDNTTNQQQGERGGDRGDRRGGGPGGGGDFRQQILDQLKGRMGVTNEDEWKVIQGKLEPVMQKRLESLSGFGRGFGRGGRGGGDNNDRPRSAIEQASNTLRETLENKDATEDQIKEKLAAFREARDKNRTELAAAQKDLKEVVTPGRQEAALVNSGYLE